MQWHGDEIVDLPPGAVLLASSSRYPNQAFRVGDRAWGLQFHIETPPEMVRRWGAEYGAAVVEAGLDPVALAERAVDELPEVEACWRPRRRALRRARRRARRAARSCRCSRADCEGRAALGVPVSVFDRRSSGTGLLVRLGFGDPTATAAALEELGLWRDGGPVDEAAGAVVTALADVADPDLALSSAGAPVAAAPDARALRAALCDAGPCAAGCSACSARASRSATTSSPTRRTGRRSRGDLDAVRPSAVRPAAALLDAVEADPTTCRGGPAAPGPG